MLGSKQIKTAQTHTERGTLADVVSMNKIQLNIFSIAFYVDVQGQNKVPKER